MTVRVGGFLAQRLPHRPATFRLRPPRFGVGTSTKAEERAVNTRKPTFVLVAGALAALALIVLGVMQGPAFG